AGYTIAVATNQSGIARGYFDKSVLDAMHRKLADLLHELGGHIDYIAYCPHGPDDNCDCRKPKTGLLLQIKQHFNTGLDNVMVVGDSLRDLQSAQEVGANPVLVTTGKGQRTLDKGIGIDNIPVYKSLADFVDTFLE
ncbi:MAG: HAD-IIIA family hydrolase, partial [Gammaproteobacteria bacterium]|nr:HAD-IIIA family hydrolase [Gammaproteobacteria bacterium]